ncbi:hypothetical protein [Paenibacillus sp. L3-i20]|uniref:hypothetical protein n=1 Tax=Paenibacillus sp. L3-i20 TaxID=2905833 RepID=UPI001EE066FF|nr:hypothetical protein [Paenibacillus sp. L3-i20]GKU77277.1 hypothetical protein L3i20_v216740 [Paenibacillus sp. L3-i20]
MKKQMVSITTALCLTFLLSASVFAANFDFTFTPPFLGSLKSSSSQLVPVASSPYVNPSQSSASTTYYLSPSNATTTAATNYQSSHKSGTHSFTYRRGYGGSGTSVKLNGYPTNDNFENYTINGTWSP